MLRCTSISTHVPSLTGDPRGQGQGNTSPLSGQRETCEKANEREAKANDMTNTIKMSQFAFARCKHLSRHMMHQDCLNAIANELPEFMGGSADLAPSNMTLFLGRRYVNAECSMKTVAMDVVLSS